MKTKFALSCLAMVAAGQALAQASIDPLLLEKQQRDAQRRSEERERLLAPPRRSIEAPPRPAVAPTPASARFVLTAVDFGPSVFITPAELDGLALPFIGKEVDFGAVNALVEKVNALYAARGQVFARAILPPQRVDNGRIRINLVESKADRIDVEGLKYLDRGFLDKVLDVAPGQTVDALRLDRSIERFQRATEARFAIDVEPGQDTATSTLKVKVAEPDRFKLRGSLNNEGNDNTGREQATADLSMFSPLGRGDRAGLGLVESRGLHSLNANYVAELLPRWGTRATVGAAVGRTHIINGAFAVNDIRGESRSWNAQVVQPLYDARPWSAETYLSYGDSKSNTSISGVDLGESHVKQYSLGLSGSMRDLVNDVAAQVAWSPYKAVAAAGGVTRSAKLEWSASYVRRYEGMGALLARANGQVSRSSTPLASVGQLSWGGAGLLRAYPAGSLIGDSGYGASVEWHGALSEKIGWSVFTEHAVIYGGLPRRSLGDAGGTLEWQYTDRTVFSATLAHGFNDGTLSSKANRAYFKVSSEF